LCCCLGITPVDDWYFDAIKLYYLDIWKLAYDDNCKCIIGKLEAISFGTCSALLLFSIFMAMDLQRMPFFKWIENLMEHPFV
jgi:hypothetical protein